MFYKSALRIEALRRTEALGTPPHHSFFLISLYHPLRLSRSVLLSPTERTALLRGGTLRGPTLVND